MLLVPRIVSAQDDENRLRQIYIQAEEEYQVGRLDQALKLLQENISRFDGNQRQSACRLIALCYLAQDNEEKSEFYARRLLDMNPYYTPVQDPVRFEEMIDRLKLGHSATITTASSQLETIEEVPVPVTLITEDMIKKSGARTLKELMIIYVPSITNIESNEETNFAMRGIYTAGQENVLILLDGHRMNSYTTNVASPDFSISLDKVKQIEILRGPASSLYGGVAYTGVVNIITKSGGDIRGFNSKVGIGNHGQLKGEMLFGSHYMGMNILAWATIYKSTGEKFHLNVDEQPNALFPHDGDVYIGGFNKSPSYDCGIKASINGLQIMFNTRFSKMQSPYTMSVMFAPYDYNNYRTFNGYAPGYAISNQHAELSYTKKLKNFNIKGALRIDHEMQQRYQIVGDSVGDFGYNDIEPYGTDDVISAYNGYYQNLYWQSTTIGANVQGDYRYQIGKQEGFITIGADYNHFELRDASYFEGDKYGQVLKTYDPVVKQDNPDNGVNSKNLALGQETMVDVYMQIKQRLSSRFILNAGLRYDYKRRNDSPNNTRNKHVVSPRIALIYKLNHWYFKGSYSKSFVDAPYYYRNSSLDISAMAFDGLDLEPEFMHSWQLSVINNQLVKGLSFDANFFYNDAKDIIINNQALGIYMNAGHLKSMGAEMSVNYNNKRLFAYGNISWQKVLESEYYTATGNRVYNVPTVQSSLVLSYNFSDAFKLHANTIFTSKQLTQSLYDGGGTIKEENIPARAIVNIGGSYELSPLTFELNVYNLFNQKYYQGGNSSAPIRQQGLWFMFNVGVKI